MVPVTSPRQSAQQSDQLKLQIILALLILIAFMAAGRLEVISSSSTGAESSPSKLLLSSTTPINNKASAAVNDDTDESDRTLRRATNNALTKSHHQSPPRPKTRRGAYATGAVDISNNAEHNTKKWPALSEVLNDKKDTVIGDPQFLLDFAIIGFEKSGSSTFMKWLGEHPQVACFQEEIYDLYQGDVAGMVKRLYKQLPTGFHVKRGYKSPGDIFLANTIHLLDEYFPKTRLILSLRHPIWYYQSIYNFRIQNNPPDQPFHTPLEGIGECKNTYPGYVCTNHANYGQYMYRLGKTLSKFPTPTEQLIIDEKPKSAAKAKVTRNLIFVVEMSQLQDKDPIRKSLLKSDLQDFLGLDIPLGDNPKVVPGKQWSAEIQAAKDKQKMKICDSQYFQLRRELMRVSKITATWILESFIQSDDVFTSSQDFFEESIKKWMIDPCTTAAEAKQ